METLQVILYVLSFLTLFTLIILGIKLIISIDRVNSILDNVEKKLKSVDNIFDAVDKISDTLASCSTRAVDGICKVVTKVLKKKQKELEGDEF